MAQDGLNLLNPNELDVVEHLGEPNRYNTGCFFGPYGKRKLKRDWVNVGRTDIINQFHTYGVLRTPTNVVMYLDGQAVFSSRECASSDPLHLILNFAVGDWYAVPPADSTVFPNWIEADYVRVWQQY